MSDETDGSDDEQSETLTFEHLQEVTGHRFLKIHTSQTTFIVQVTHRDLEDLKEVITSPPTTL